MGFENFPYTNFHELNLDWIAKIAKDFLEQYTHIQELISNGEQSLQDLTASGLADLQEKADALEQLLQEWYNTHSEDIAQELTRALNEAISSFNSFADQKAQTTIASIPADYTALSAFVNNSFSERTTNEFNYQAANVLNYYWNTTNNTLRTNAGVRSILIPVNSANGTTVLLSRHNKGRLYWIALPFDDPAQLSDGMNVASYNKQHTTNGYYYSITIDATIKSIFVWYYYDAEDTGENPEYILSHLMLAYKPIYVPFQPYYAVNGYHSIQKSDLYGNPDFNSWDYMQNVIAFVNRNTDVLINTPLGDYVRGSWVIRSEVFSDTPDRLWVLQSAFIFNYRGSVGITNKVAFYQRYRIYDRNTNEFENDDLTAWKEVRFSADPEIRNYYESEPKASPYAWDDYVSLSTGTGVWITDYLYPAGLVKSIRLNIGSENTVAGYIIFINPTDGSIINKVDFNNRGAFYVDVNRYISTGFYIGINAPGSYFKSGSYQPQGEFNTRFILYNEATITNHTIIDFSRFNAAGSNSYCLAQEITYGSYKDLLLDRGYSVSANNMYVMGDSITAGHNTYIAGNHWWNAVAREYGYEVKLGARTGAGMSYYNGINACQIVTEQDLTPYNVIVVAFGTNDYGNNQELGTINDNYTYSLDSSQTFYAATKYVVQKIKEQNPYVTIIFSLPINRSREGNMASKWAYNYQNRAGYTLNDYCEAIINVCNMYGLPYIDHRNGAFDLYSTPVLTYDGLHPTVYGYKILGCEMIARIGAIIKPYPENDGQDE